MRHFGRRIEIINESKDCKNIGNMFGTRIKDLESNDIYETNEDVAGDSYDEYTDLNQRYNFSITKPEYILDDMILDEKTRNNIEAIFNKITYYNKLYIEWNLKKIDKNGDKTVINLFGESGTGKTMLAHSIASYFNKKIIEVNYAELESKYFGETGKNIDLVFKAAEENDSVIFFDEADAILSKRITNYDNSATHSINITRSVMLNKLEKFRGIIIFCTNLPGNYDKAFARRINFNINIPLPDLLTRRKIWKTLIPDEVPGKNDLNYDKITEMSIGFSGGDIKNCIIKTCSIKVIKEDGKDIIETNDILDTIMEYKHSKNIIGNIENKFSNM